MDDPTGKDNKDDWDEQDFIETTLASEQVFDGGLLKVYADTVRLPDGHESRREYIKHPGAVVIIARLDNGKLLFERQFRYPVGRVFLELPAGKIDPNEHILDTARRELREETGYKARRWLHLGTMHPCIGYSDERIEIFWAEGLSFVGAQLDPGEVLDVCEISLADAMQAIRDGDITDAKTSVGLLWAEKTLTGAWPLPD